MKTAKFLGWMGIIIATVGILSPSDEPLGMIDLLIICIVFISIANTCSEQQSKIENMEKRIEELECNERKAQKNN